MKETIQESKINPTAKKLMYALLALALITLLASFYVKNDTGKMSLRVIGLVSILILVW